MPKSSSALLRRAEKRAQTQRAAKAAPPKKSNRSQCPPLTVNLKQLKARYGKLVTVREGHSVLPDPTLLTRSPSIRSSSPRPHQTSKLLALPREVRQIVLYNTLSDDEISNESLASEAQELRRVCTTFEEDMGWVLQSWQAREVELRAMNQAFRSYAAELIAPLRQAQAIPHDLRGNRQQLRNERKRLRASGTAVSEWKIGAYIAWRSGSTRRKQRARTC